MSTPADVVRTAAKAARLLGDVATRLANEGTPAQLGALVGELDAARVDAAPVEAAVIDAALAIVTPAYMLAAEFVVEFDALLGDGDDEI